MWVSLNSYHNFHTSSDLSTQTLFNLPLNPSNSLSLETKTTPEESNQSNTSGAISFQLDFTL